MAWNDPLFPKDDEPRRAIDTGMLKRAVDQVGKDITDEQARGAQRMTAAVHEYDGARTAPVHAHSDFELAVNDATGQVMLANGNILKMDAPTMVHLATMEGLQKFKPDAQLPQGFRRYTQAKLKEGVDSIPTESDFWGNVWANIKSTLGLGVAAIKTELSDEDPSNSWSNAQAQHASEQTIGQYKSTQAPWFSGVDAFISNLGTNAGNVSGGVVMAAPTALAGSAIGTGAEPGGGTLAGFVGGLGWALSGGLPAYGDQSTSFYSAAMDAMKNMTPEQLAQESPLYQQVVVENPSLSFDEVKKKIAAEGARAAGRVGSIPGAIEAVIGSRLAGNMLAKVGFKSSIFRPIGKAAERTAKGESTSFAARALSVGKPVGRMALGGAGAAGMEMSESAFGQAAGAHATGIGSDNPLDNVNPQEGVQASQLGAIFGLFGARGHGGAHASNDIANALKAQAGQQSPNGATAFSDPAGPAYLRRGATNFPNLPGGTPQQALPLDIPHDYNMDSRSQQPLSATDVSQGQPQADAPGQDPNQLPLDFNAQPPAPTAPPSPQQQAMQTFLEITGIQSPDELQQRIPELMQIGDEHPAFMQLMQDAGVIGILQGQSPEISAQNASDALEQWNRAPATFDGMQAQGEAPLRAGTTVDVPAGREAPNFTRNVRGPDSAQRAAVSMQVPSQPELPAVESPEPLSAPQERTPDGRPLGVAPAPLPNPEPMSPEQAKQAAATRNRRRAAAGDAPSEVPADQSAATPEQAAAPAQEPAGRAPIELPIDALRTRRGEIGRQGVGEDQVRSILRNVLGLSVHDRATMREMVDQLKADPAAIHRLRKFVEAHPLLGYELPDGTLAIADGHHRAFLLDQAGEKTIPARMEDYTGPAGEMQARATPEQVTAAAQSSNAQVSPSTPEPAEDIGAQVEAMLDPESGRLAVYVAQGNESAIPQDLPPDVLVVSRKGRGTLLTLNPDLAKQFQRGKWTDQDTARVLGYSESKGEAIASGSPTVVEARTPEGAVAAQQLTTNTPSNKRAAAAAVARQARKNATVVETSAEQAQADRAQRATPRNPVAAAITERRREKKAAPKKRGRKATSDEERTDAAQAGTANEAATEPAPRLDVSGAAQSQKATLRAGNKQVALTGTLIHETGQQGAHVDLRVQHLDETLRMRLQHYLEAGVLNADDAKAAKATLTHFDQLGTMLDAAVDRAEQRLLDRVADAGPQGEAVLNAAEQAQLRAELADRRASKERGRPHGRPKESPLLYVPLLPQEMHSYANLARAEAKAAGRTAQSAAVARRLVSELVPGFDKLVSSLGEARVLQAFAALSDGELATLVRSAAPSLSHSFLAKQVMRGAAELARVHVREDAEVITAAKRARTAKTLHESQLAGPVTITASDMGLEPEKHPNVTAYRGDLPPNAGKVVDGWVAMMERGGIKLSGELRVLSMQAAKSLYPTLFTKNVLGQYRAFMENGKEVHIIAVDWSGAVSEGHAVETLAHEFGHYVSREVFNRSDFRTQQAVLEAYDAWMQTHGMRSPVEILRSHLPGLLQKALPSDANVAKTYATSFKEWSANHVARFLLTRPEPSSLVEKYFARVADLLRKVYAGMFGTEKPNRAWAEALDAWISGAAAENAEPKYKMIDSPDGEDMRALFGPADAEPEELPGAKTARAVINRSTAALDGAKREFGDVLNMALGRDAKGLRGKVNATMDHVLGTKLGALLREKVGLSLTTLDQMVKLYANTPLGESLGDWTRLQKLRAQVARVALHGGEFEVEKGQKLVFKGAAVAVENANKLSTKVRNLLQDVMYYATHYGIHPDKAWNDPANAHLQAEDSRALGANARRYAHVSNLWAQLGTMDPSALQIYADLRDAFTDLHGHTLERLIQNIKESGFSEKAKERAIENVERARRELKQGPYFPLMRFGDWVVTSLQPMELLGKDGGKDLFETKAEAEAERRVQKSLYPGAVVRVEKVDDAYGVRVFRRGVYFFESPNEARAAKAQIEADMREQFDAAGVDIEDVVQALANKLNDEEHAPELISAPKRKLDFYNGEIAPGDQFLQELRSDMASKGVKMDPEMAQIFENLYLESLPEYSARKSMLPRQNVMGASRKMLQSYAHRFAGSAHAYSGVAYGREINKAWQAMRAVRDESGFEPTGSVLNVLHANQQAIADRTKSSLGNKVANMLTDLSSAFSLAFSPAYVLTNAMQPTMVTLPVLAGASYRDNAGNVHTVGAAKAMTYLKDAYDGAIPFFSKRGVADFINEAKRLAGAKAKGEDLQSLTPKMIESFGRTADEQAMLTMLLERGRLDFSFLNSIEDAMRGGWASQKLGAVARLGMAFPQQVEAMNRVTSALAAYRVATQELGMEHADAQEYAADVVGETQLDYSRLNRPLLFNKAGLSVVLQFKLYVQGMYALFARNAYLATMHEDKAMRQQGRATLAYLMGTHGAIAGTVGLPMAGVAKVAMGLAAAMGMPIGGDDDDDKWKSPEQVLHERAQGLFGGATGTVEHGLPALLGLDVSDRLGFPSLLDSRYTGIRDGDDAGTQMDKWTTYLLGAPYANLRRIVQGAGNALDDDPFTRPEVGLPSGARALLKAYRVAGEGLVDRDGDTFIGPDALSWRDTAITALGFQPAGVQEQYRERSEVKSTIAQIRDARELLIKRWRTASSEDKAKLRDEIREFNDSTPRNFRITGHSLQQSERSKSQRDAGQTNRQEAAVKEMMK